MAASIDDALELVTHHFRGMTDKDGEPYVMHCLRVMMGVTDPLAQQAAVMHDLVEDTPITMEDLRARGFCEEVLTAVDLLTHKSHESYSAYVVRIKQNTIARQVKLADLRDNTAPNRVLYREARVEGDLNRIQRYLLSYQYLTDRIEEQSYRERMAAFEKTS
jgi:hypothetical protein